MKQIQNQNNKVDVTKVGYSDNRLQPCYLLFTTLFFLALPIFGQFAALLIVGVPAFMIALKVAELERKDPVAEAARWQSIHDLYVSIEERDRLAEERSKEPDVIKEKQPKQVFILNNSVPAR
ncbi:MAG: hypothetical protein QG628_797 [Patescibacteria group bacterium]|nr:hypothetical protein [Patescibacteria group bacterium]